jgi:hypothetical protein
MLDSWLSCLLSSCYAHNISPSSKPHPQESLEPHLRLLVLLGWHSLTFRPSRGLSKCVNHILRFTDSSSRFCSVIWAWCNWSKLFIAGFIRSGCELLLFYFLVIRLFAADVWDVYSYIELRHLFYWVFILLSYLSVVDFDVRSFFYVFFLCLYVIRYEVSSFIVNIFGGLYTYILIDIAYNA